MKHVLILIAMVSVLAGSAGAEEGTRPAPLMVAQDRAAEHFVFQFGADAFGGLTMGGIEFIAGVNATLMYPVMDLLWVGIRPSFHYAFQEDSDFEITWFHPDVTFHINFLHDPVRLYFVGAGGYSFVLDTDLYDGVADGWSVLGGVGVSWRPGDGWGLFAELGFRLGFASQSQTVLDLDDNGNPQCADAECLTYLTRDVSRDFDLTVLTINLGVLYQL